MRVNKTDNALLMWHVAQYVSDYISTGMDRYAAIARVSEMTHGILTPDVIADAHALFSDTNMPLGNDPVSELDNALIHLLDCASKAER